MALSENRTLENKLAAMLRISGCVQPKVVMRLITEARK